ncbi:formylglycine-generating enzyme family protein [Qipengyuania flava]|uniref:formylglycine-generating enzyme family protein n=1 Tax=Qipengyuania flava TaxID=192812 RepID=UPI001C624864|nr:formylglycine-generating enzyme family protein [Qipengyuania flava]QYJ06853.1 formylglycine-generating enzyme family protein [Qipengyuania flava]
MQSRVFALALLFLAGCSAQEEDDAPKSEASQCKGISKPGEMVWIEGGKFVMGEAPRYPEEGPPREVEIPGFWISATEVTNAQFAEFVRETGYVTMAEREPPNIPGAPPEMLQPGSATFRLPTSDNPSWWSWTVGAQWRAPNGIGSSIKRRMNDPVVQVAYDDALAYAEWAGKGLPSEEQWEYAARAGLGSLTEPKDATGKPLANYYQGVFPARDLGEDGFTSRAPVGCFEPNAFGLFDMIGNVWEWTSTEGARADAIERVGVIKGGSFLCAANYCARYRPAARQFQERGLGTDHIGFRVIDTAREPPALNGED